MHQMHHADLLCTKRALLLSAHRLLPCASSEAMLRTHGEGLAHYWVGGGSCASTILDEYSILVHAHHLLPLFHVQPHDALIFCFSCRNASFNKEQAEALDPEGPEALLGFDSILPMAEKIISTSYDPAYDDF